MEDIQYTYILLENHESLHTAVVVSPALLCSECSLI